MGADGAVKNLLTHSSVSSYIKRAVQGDSAASCKMAGLYFCHSL